MDHVSGGRERPSTRLFAAGILFAGTALSCTAVRHSPTVVTNGLSWFGTHRPTVVPFVTAMSIVALLLLTAARRIEPVDAEAVVGRWGLTLVGLLLLGVLATPYTIDAFFNWTHMLLGAALFSIQFGISIWLWLRRRDAISLAAAVVLLTAGLLAVASLANVVNVLLYVQIVFQFVFLMELPLLVRRTTAVSVRR